LKALEAASSRESISASDSALNSSITVPEYGLIDFSDMKRLRAFRMWETVFRRRSNAADLTVTFNV
jgi:hypothetical protein